MGAAFKIIQKITRLKISAMKKCILMMTAFMAVSSCSIFEFKEEDWAVLYPEMNAHLKYLCIDEDGLWEKFDDPLGLGEQLLEYIPEAARIVDAYVEDELASYQDIAEFPDLSDRMEDMASEFVRAFLGFSPAEECMTMLCDYIRDSFNEQDDFTLSFPELYTLGDDLITYYTTYCEETGEYYLISYNDDTEEMSYDLSAVELE